MNNECKVIFLCKDSDEKPCAYKVDKPVCKYAKEYLGTVSCTSKRAKRHALEAKERKLNNLR